MNVHITIDGPTASGKGSIARAIANHFQFFYLDTGLLYRAMGYLALHDFTAAELELGLFWDEQRVAGYRDRIRYCYERGLATVLVDGQEVTAALRTPRSDWAASHVSSVPLVRVGLRQWQRALGEEHSIVVDGRDCGTVLFPDAAYKFFLTASVAVRVQRAMADKARDAAEMGEDAVRQAVLMRDLRDLSRPLSPLRPAPDAIILDTSVLGLEAATALVLSYIVLR